MSSSQLISPTPSAMTALSPSYLISLTPSAMTTPSPSTALYPTVTLPAVTESLTQSTATSPLPPSLDTPGLGKSLELIVSGFSLALIVVLGVGLVIICFGVMGMVVWMCRKKREVSVRKTETRALEQPLVLEMYNRKVDDFTQHQSFTSTTKDSTVTVSLEKRVENDYTKSNKHTEIATSGNVAYKYVSPTHVQVLEEIYDDTTVINNENIYDNESPDSPEEEEYEAVIPQTGPQAMTEEEEEYEAVIPQPIIDEEEYEDVRPQPMTAEEEDIYDNDTCMQREDSEDEYQVMAVNPYLPDDAEEDIYDN